MSNEELYRRARSGGPDSEAAARELFERLRVPAFLTALKYLAAETDARDAAARALSDLFTLSNWQGVKKVAPYLRTMVRNAALDQLERRARTQRAEATYTAKIFSLGGVESAARGRLAGSDATDRSRYRQLLAAIGDLGERQREALTLHYFSDYSYRQISEITRTSLTQVKSAIQHGKRNLAKRLDEPPAPRE